MRPKVTILTYTPSPYQVELFDEVTSKEVVDLQVLYLHSQDRERHWKERPRAHAALSLPVHRAVSGDAVNHTVNADLFVLNYYHDPRALSLLRERLATRQPWVFWGERTGFRHPLLGRMLRKWKLRALHTSSAPIWGIGQWAVEGYQSEFGRKRPYVNLPYFSDLGRFRRPQSAAVPETSVNFLFSGSLILRKGVDLLAEAFVRLSKTHPKARLQLLGTGPEEARLREMLRPCGSQVDFLGFADWPDVPGRYHGAHVLCVPSRHDGWGLVVPEGLAAGLPVIATERTGAARDLLKRGENGWLVPAHDANSLYQAMHEAASLRADQWETMSDAAVRSVSQHTLSHGAERFLAAAASAMRSGTIR